MGVTLQHAHPTGDGNDGNSLRIVVRLGSRLHYIVDVRLVYMPLDRMFVPLPRHCYCTDA